MRPATRNIRQLTAKKAKLTGASKPKAGNHLVLCYPDVHFPYHDEAAVGCMLHVVELLKPEYVVGLGDLLDAGKFSSYPKKTLREAVTRNFKESEIKPANAMLDRIQRYAKKLVVIEGNHEARIEAMAARLGKDAPDLCDLISPEELYDLISPKALLSAGRSNFTWVPYHDELSHYAIAKNLWAIHGTYFGTHAAYAHLQAYKPLSVIFGHIHRMQSYTTRDPMTRKVIKAWSPGCLSKLQPLYQMNSPTSWAHGISLIYVKDNRQEFTEYNCVIQDGEVVLPGGRTVKA